MGTGEGARAGKGRRHWQVALGLSKRARRGEVVAGAERGQPQVRGAGSGRVLLAREREGHVDVCQVEAGVGGGEEGEGEVELNLTQSGTLHPCVPSCAP